MSEQQFPAEAPAVVAHGAGDLRIEPMPVVPPGDDEAVVAIAYGGVCGSDLHYWRDGAAGESIIREPLILGHEVVGTVMQSAPTGGPAVGTPVAIHPARLGTTNVRFPADRPNISPAVTYLGSAARYPHTAGSFVAVRSFPVEMLRPLPAGLSLRTAALAEPASVAWHAVRRAGDVRGKRVLVVGSGPIGSLIVAVLRRAGAAEIVAVDMFDRPLEIATAVGATRTLRAPDPETIAAVDADVSIESSGNHRGLSSAIHGTTRGGRVVLVGLLPTGDQPVPMSIAITRELELVGSFRFHDEMDEVLLALADGSLFVDPVITHEYDAGEALAAFDTASDAATSGKVLLRF